MLTGVPRGMWNSGKAQGKEGKKDRKQGKADAVSPPPDPTSAASASPPTETAG